MFLHHPIDLGYKDLETEYDKNGRFYLCEGKRYISVTSLLNKMDKSGLDDWKKRVGEKEAKRICKIASGRGTDVHLMIERYLNNEENVDRGIKNIVAKKNFRDIKPVLESRIKNVFLQEAPLFSHRLKLAGRLDLFGEFDHIPSIIDFKTSAKLKKREYIQGYIFQQCLYSLMLYERTGINVRQLVTLITVDYEKPQIFIENRDDHLENLFDFIKLTKHLK